MAKKITIQHWYTTNTGTTAVPPASGLTLGEIAISAGKKHEGIYFKNSVNEVVGVLTSEQTHEIVEKATSGITKDSAFQMHRENLASEYDDGNIKDINKYGHVLLHDGDLSGVTGYTEGVAASNYHTHGQYLTGVTGDSGQPIVSRIENGVAKIGLTTGITNQINSGVTANMDIVTHKAVSGGTDLFGHVKLKSGDLSSITAITEGEAAASYHTHGQYLKETDIISGTGIYVTNFGLPGIVSVNISEEYQNMISSGVTAYDWGNHADEGYAKNDDLKTLRNNISAHTNNKIVHITPDERNDWNTAADRINTFLYVESGATTALDSLHEIQEYLTGDGNSVKTLLESLNNLTDKVSGNTDDITSLKDKVSGNTNDITNLKQNTVPTLQSDVQNRVHTIDAVGNLSATTSTTGKIKKYTITHTPASTENTTTITATNSNTAISFGSDFDIVNKIEYDANGHVVTASTQTLTLPNLLTATTNNYGVVKIKGGQLTLVKELVNADYSKTAAGVAHGHTEYVKYDDLNDYKGTTPLVISCGTY